MGIVLAVLLFIAMIIIAMRCVLTAGGRAAGGRGRTSSAEHLHLHLMGYCGVC